MQNSSLDGQHYTSSHLRFRMKPDRNLLWATRSDGKPVRDFRLVELMREGRAGFVHVPGLRAAREGGQQVSRDCSARRPAYPHDRFSRESPRFREVGNSGRIHTWDNVTKVDPVLAQRNGALAKASSKSCNGES